MDRVNLASPDRM